MATRVHEVTGNEALYNIVLVVLVLVVLIFIPASKQKLVTKIKFDHQESAI